MREVSRYICETCKAEYDTEEGCSFCERSHGKLLEIVDSEWGLSDVAPYSVTISLLDENKNIIRKFKYNIEGEES